MTKLLPIALTACTSLGPMPTTTGLSAIPAGRPGAEAQLGAMPAYFLSSSASQPRGAAVIQLAATIEPDHWIGVPGLLLGGRVYGQNPDSPAEPFVGYRRKLGDELAVSAVGFGTAKRATSRLASYHAVRAGGEVAIDGLVFSFTRWLAMHVQASASATYVSASGTYCIDAMGIGKDCDEMDPAQNQMIDGRVRGLYPAGTAQASLDVGRTGAGMFHSARLAILASTGTMPTAVNGVQGDSHTFLALGLSLTLGLGSSD